MTAKAAVSLCMIVRNEAGQLAACVEPVGHLFQEIVVVDTGSADRTRDVAASLGARVFEFSWCDDFSAARNASLDHAQGDWIFWLDADDRLEPAQVQRLGELLGALDQEPRAYVMTCLSLPQYAVDRAIVLPQCRLFRRQPQIRWSRRVHEQILPAIEQLGQAVVCTDIQITHLGYQDAALLRRKANRDLRLLRLEYATNPKDPVTLFNLGMVFLRTGQAGEALTYLLPALKHATGRGEWIRRLHAITGETLCQLGRPEEALAVWDEGLRRFPLDTSLTTRRADLLNQLGELGQAERALLELLRSPLGQEGLTTDDDSILDRREARYLLGMNLRDQRRFLDAERIFQDALAAHPEFVKAWVGLGYVYLDQQHFSQVEHVARQVDKCPCGAAYAAVLRALNHMHRGNLPVAREFLDRAMALAPQMIWPRLVLAEWLTRSGAPISARIAAQRDLVRMNPGNPSARVELENLLRQENGQTSPPGLWFSVSP